MSIAVNHKLRSIVGEDWKQLTPIDLAKKGNVLIKNPEVSSRDLQWIYEECFKKDTSKELCLTIAEGLNTGFNEKKTTEKVTGCLKLLSEGNTRYEIVPGLIIQDFLVKPLSDIVDRQRVYADMRGRNSTDNVQAENELENLVNLKISLTEKKKRFKHRS